MGKARPLPLWKHPRSIAVIKGMIARGDKHQDISPHFDNVNVGRIAEIKRGMHGADQIAAAPPDELPPPGPSQVPMVDTHDFILTVLEESALPVSQWRDHVAKTQGDDAAQGTKMTLTRIHVAIDQRRRDIFRSKLERRADG